MKNITTSGIGSSFYQHYPRIVVIAASKCKSKNNVMAVAWHMPISFNPPLYGISISEKRFSYGLIAESGEFTVNFMPNEKAEIVAAAGGTKGKEIDKFRTLGIKKEKGGVVDAPVLSDAYAAYECRLVSDEKYGDHHLLIGEIVATHCNEDVFTEGGTLNINNTMPVLYMGNDQYLDIENCSLETLDRELCVEKIKANKN